MEFHREISRLTTDMNIITGSGRPSRNSQGICSTSQHPTRCTTLLLEAQSIPINLQFSRSVLTKNGSHPASNTTNTLPSQRQVEALTHSIRQNDRFVDPSGNPLQLGYIIVCNDLPFVVSNSKIYNFTGGNMKHLYISGPSEHKFLVTSVNSPSTFSNIFSSVLSLFQGLVIGRATQTNIKIKTRSNLQLRLQL